MDSTARGLIDELDREHHRVLEKIRAANRDLQERIENLGVSVSYSRDDDALMVTFGETTEALMESVDDNILVRVEPETSKIVGIEVLDLKTSLPDHPQILALILALLTLMPCHTAGGRYEADNRSAGYLAECLQQLITSECSDTGTADLAHPASQLLY